jgi:PAS domain S-box-containing protein
LKLKLSEPKPDLIIAVSYPAINFLLETGKDLFPETPIVFSCVGDSFGENLKIAIARAGRHNVSGILLGNQQGATLKLAFQLQPDTQRVVAVAGTTPLEKFWVNQLEKDLALSQPGITFTYLSNMPMDDILKKVAALPPHTVIFYPYFFLDANGSFFSPEEALDLISGAANVPVYGSFHSYIGHGLLGGRMLDFEDVAAKTAEDASRALRREQTPDPEFAVDTTSSITVDWRELRRWNISESRLPPGTVVLFKEKSLLNRFRWYILGFVTLCLCEAILIFALLIQGARRKRAEEALRESEARLHLAAQVGKMYAYEWDVATDKVVRSEECISVLGPNDQPKQLTRQQLLASVHPDDRALFVGSVDRLTPGNPTTQLDYRVLRPDGSVVWLEKNARAFFDQQGKMLRMIGMVADVTEGKKAEEAVLQREKELLEAQRVAQVGSWQWDQKTDAVAWSKELYRIAGRDPALSPPSFKEQSQLYTPESWERLECAVAEALRTGTAYELDLRMIRPDGSTRWIIDRGEVLRDAAGQIAWLRGTAQDITERKQAEDALQASEEKFRSVFRDAGVGMVIVSPEGRFLAANEAFCDCLGYTEEELLQKTVESVTLAEDWQSFSQRLRESLERGTSFQRVEKRCLHKSGRIVITESSASLIRGPSGESRYFVGEVLDITQRKLADEALSSVSRRLIEAHEEERTRIARELHDDINQRMALLSGNLERVKEILPASDVQARALVDEAGQRVSDLASDIQSLSHRLHSSNLEYLGLVPACDGFCREVSERQKIEIDFRAGAIPKALPKEISLCLFRVLQEALMNAIKHSEARRFEVGLVNVSSDIELTVHDSGIGFDLEKAMSGQGLGLTSMRERLKLVDGQLFIDSKLQGGTTVHARVPTNARMKTAGASE